MQQFFAPTGATRLYLGATDGFGWFNNSGVSDVTITYTAPPTGGAAPEPATRAMMILGFEGAGAVIRRRRAQAAQPAGLPAQTAHRGRRLVAGGRAVASDARVNPRSPYVASPLRRPSVGFRLAGQERQGGPP